MSSTLPYHELHRPQFHFSPRTNWTNDPNGMVYYKGEYHLFYQLNARGLRWGPNTWGHAVSTDLVHWQQLGHAIEPDEYGWIWSGSAVVDWNNTAGLKKGPEETLVAIYSTGGVGRHGYPNTPVVQKIHYSNDRGRTWKAFEGNPVLGHVRAENRDLKVIWHEPSLDAWYQVRLEPASQRLVVDLWRTTGTDPLFTFERPLAMAPGRPVHLRAIVDGTCLVVYADNRVALSCRMYDPRGSQLELFVNEGKATFAGTRLLTRP